MKLPFLPAGKLVCLLTLAVSVPAARAELIHRYSFNDGSARDLVGSIDGKLKGAGATLAGGKLVLKNEESASGDKISCLEFAGSVLPKSGAVSLVVWFAARDTGPFARVFNFGDSEGTEGKQFIYLTPHNADGVARAAVTGSDVSAKTVIDFDALDDDRPHMVALVIDDVVKKLRVFVDGREPVPAENLGENTLDRVKPVENWLGRSSFAADPGLTATIDEFRVYDHALTLTEAAALAKAGPEVLPPAVASSSSPAK